MRVQLTVKKGASAGKVFEVKLPQFVIGRSKGCQLKPQSDAVSRKHCVILLTNDTAVLRDLKSRNGTVVNGDLIKGEHQLATGDEIRVGPLLLDVAVLDANNNVVYAKKAKKEPVSTDPSKTQRVDAKEAIPATPSTGDSGIISDWLDDEGNTDTGISRLETRRFEIEDTDHSPAAAPDDPSTTSAQSAKKKAKKEPGKLPKREEDSTANSKEAAEKTLEKMRIRGL